VADAAVPAVEAGTASLRAQATDMRRAAPRRRARGERGMGATMRVAERVEES